MKECFKNFSVSITGEEIKPEELRNDVSEDLGEPLSRRQKELFVCLMSNGAEPMSTEKLYRELVGDDSGLDKAHLRGVIGSLVRRTRDRLGNEAIVTKVGEGYIARNRLIKKQVEENRVD